METRINLVVAEDLNAKGLRSSAIYGLWNLWLASATKRRL